ncbi:hypothetical protein FF1_040232 [Malus domestica]
MDKSIRPTQEFEGQNKSIKSRVRSTLMIWDTFAVDKVVDVVWRGFALWRRIVSTVLRYLQKGFMTLTTVKDEYSRAMLGKSKGKGKDKEKT